MAIFRKVHTTFWTDVFVRSLTPERKYFFLYLVTNGQTKQCGIYEISISTISHDTGYTTDVVKKLLDYFVESGKIKVSPATEEIAIKNWEKYQSSKSPSVQQFVNKELALVKDQELVQWVHSGGMVVPSSPQREQEREREREPEGEGEPKALNVLFDEFWKLYDKKTSPKESCEKKWLRLKDEERLAAIEYIPEYKIAQPEKRFRKDPATFLNQKAWNNELIYTNGTATHLKKSGETNGRAKSGSSQDRIDNLRKW